mmetsp:Transcript_18036/g.31400  ORF Transcript_18036/g.31400 Transcript_18036/m.31400 type:complete len:214 (+) Transcript_18036:1862-2503(+)
MLLLLLLLLFLLLLLLTALVGGGNRLLFGIVTSLASALLLLLLAVLLTGGSVSSSSGILENGSTELVGVVGLTVCAAGNAVQPDGGRLLLALDELVSLGVLARATKHELLDVLEKHLLEIRGLEGAVNDRTVSLLLVAAHGAELTAKELGHLSGGAVQSSGDVGTVHDHGLDTVAAALDLAHELGHLVAVRRVIGPVNIERGGHLGEVGLLCH